MPETGRFRWPWRRPRTPAATSRPRLEHGAIPWLLAVAVATTLPHVEHLPWWLSLFAGIALLGRAWLWLRNGRLPRRWALALLVFAGTAGIAWQYRTLFGRDPGIALLVFFMALKPMEMSARRDGLVTVMLGFFLLLTHYFHSEDIATGVWLLASIGFGILFRPLLARVQIGGADLGFWFAQQGSILVFLALIFYYAWRVSRLDREHGVED